MKNNQGGYMESNENQTVPDVHIQLKCKCGDITEHVVHLCQFNDNEWGDHLDGTCIISTSMNHYQGFFKRIRTAFKYILGIDNNGIHYVETIVNIKDLKEAVDKLYDMSGE